MGKDEEVVVLGVEPGYLTARERNVTVGDKLVLQDRYNAVITNTVMDEFDHRPFTLMAPFELTLSVNGRELSEKFRVKGVVEEVQSFGMGVIYIPIKTLNELMETDGYTEISLFAADTDHVERVKREAMAMLDRLFKVPAGQELDGVQEEESFFGLPLPLAEGEREEYKITTQADILEVSEEISGMIQLAVVAIAGISLLVGGIGIANVMLVTVAERTREIGVMKAVGGKNRQILTMFLFESAIIGLFGGLIGLGIAALAAYTLTPVLMGVPGALPMEWAGIGIGISLAIGVLSGLYPALRASRMDPVQALRTE
jgi:putative ABC transport system permease protein